MMMDFLNFTFQDGWHFLGIWLLFKAFSFVKIKNYYNKDT